MVQAEVLVVALCLYPLALLPFLILASKYQREQSQNRSRLKALKNLRKERQAEKAELMKEIRSLTSRLIDSDYRLYDFQQDLKESEFRDVYQLLSAYRKLKEKYQSREHLIESLFLEVKKEKLQSPAPAEFESQQWQSGYPQSVARLDSTEEISR
jgi:septal ring factor EnvC (AmiA/AmiB activator)